MNLNSADKSAAIQKYIDTAAQRGGGVVELTAGTFLIDSPIILQNNVELIGAGAATILKAGPKFLSTQGPEGGYPLITTDGASDVTIANLTADQNGNSLNGSVTARLAGYTIESRKSHNVLISGVYVRNPFTYSIAMARTTDFCITKSYTTAATSNRYNQLDGIHILDSSWGEVINNVVQAGEDGLVAHTIGASVHDILYANNIVHAGAHSAGMQLAVGNFPIYDISILNNNFYGSLYGIRTGYYDSRTGAIYDILIKGNFIHDLSQGQRFPAILIGGFGGLGPIREVTIASNRICVAGAIVVKSNPSNVVTSTTGCQQLQSDTGSGRLPEQAQIDMPEHHVTIRLAATTEHRRGVRLKPLQHSELRIAVTIISWQTFCKDTIGVTR